MWNLNSSVEIHCRNFFSVPYSETSGARCRYFGGERWALCGPNVTEKSVGIVDWWQLTLDVPIKQWLHPFFIGNLTWKENMRLDLTKCEFAKKSKPFLEKIIINGCTLYSTVYSDHPNQNNKVLMCLYICTYVMCLWVLFCNRHQNKRKLLDHILVGCSVFLAFKSYAVKRYREVEYLHWEHIHAGLCTCVHQEDTQTILSGFLFVSAGVCHLIKSLYFLIFQAYRVIHLFRICKVNIATTIFHQCA